MNNANLIFLYTLSVLYISSQSAQAEEKTVIQATSLAQQGLTKLLSVLPRLKEQSAITVELNATFSDQHDESLKQGNVKAILSTDVSGFQLTYPTSELNKITREKEQLMLLLANKDSDTDSLTPTLAAAHKLKAIDLDKTLNMSRELLLLIQRAKFIEDQSSYSPTQENNVLTFTLPIDMMLRNKKTRQYVDDFTATYQLFISNEGVPLKSALIYEGSGSAYLVLHIEAYGSKFETFTVVNNRLILSESSSTKGSKSLFGDFERNQTKTLRLLDTVNLPRTAIN